MSLLLQARQHRQRRQTSPDDASLGCLDHRRGEEHVADEAVAQERDQQ